MESIRVWRNQQMAVLRQKNELSRDDQEKYFSQVIQPLLDQAQPNQILFEYRRDNELIGYGGLVHISWEDLRAEMSFLVAPERHQDLELYSADFKVFISFMQSLCFEVLEFNRLFTETYAFRKEHMQILESQGFKKEGVLRDHILFEGQKVDAIMHSVLKNEFITNEE